MGLEGKCNFFLDLKKALALDQLSFGLWIDEIITFFSVIFPYHEMHVCQRRGCRVEKELQKKSLC